MKVFPARMVEPAKRFTRQTNITVLVHKVIPAETVNFVSDDLIADVQFSSRFASRNCNFGPTSFQGTGRGETLGMRLISNWEK